MAADRQHPAMPKTQPKVFNMKDFILNAVAIFSLIAAIAILVDGVWTMIGLISQFVNPP
jgi:hypothetical protein